MVFGLSRGTNRAKYTRILFAFMSSGVMHLGVDLSAGVALHDSSAVRFFVTQALGLIFEDCIMSIYCLAPHSMRLPATLTKTLGFVWVLLFLTWSVPAYLYPMMWRSNQGLQDSTIPFSFFGPEAQRGQALGFLSILGTFAFSREVFLADMAGSK